MHKWEKLECWFYSGWCNWKFLSIKTIIKSAHYTSKAITSAVGLSWAKTLKVWTRVVHLFSSYYVPELSWGKYIPLFIYILATWVLRIYKSITSSFNWSIFKGCDHARLPSPKYCGDVWQLSHWQWIVGCYGVSRRWIIDGYCYKYQVWKS